MKKQYTEKLVKPYPTLQEFKEAIARAAVTAERAKEFAKIAEEVEEDII